jgi:peptidoglycan/LPS O-acetylase OafA/YrhL
MSRNAPLPDRLASLDWLRLVAALAVVAFHYLFRGAAADDFLETSYPEAAGYALYGYLGVNLFFLISGYVIAWSAEGRNWVEFSLARFVRLYPGFVVCMTVSFAILWTFDPAWGHVGVRQYLANLLMFSPALGQPFVDGVYWSIVLELIFYFWVTVVLIAGAFQRLRLELVAGWLVLCAVNEFAIGSGAMRFLCLTEYGPLFASGILVHHIRTRGGSAEAFVLLAASLALSTSLMGIAKDWMQGHYGVSVPLAHLVLANLAMHALLVAAVFANLPLRSGAVSLAVGGLTYPLYLLHQNAGYVAINLTAPALGRWEAVAIVAVAMVALAWGIWRFVEAPLRRLLMRLARTALLRLQRRSAALASA